MMSSALPLMALVTTSLALPLTSNEVRLREIAISESKPELLRTAVKYARYVLITRVIRERAGTQRMDGSLVW